MAKQSGIRDQDELERRVCDMVETVAAAMDLGWLKITNGFHTDAEDRIICQTVADWEYRQSSLKWSLVQLATLTDEDLLLTIIHELVHCLNAPVWESLSSKEQGRLEKLNELATENCARAIAHLYKGAS